MKAILSLLADFVSAGLQTHTPLVEASAGARVDVLSPKDFWFSGDARQVGDDAIMDRAVGLSRSAQRLDALSPPTLSKAPESPKTARTPGG